MHAPFPPHFAARCWEQPARGAVRKDDYMPSTDHRRSTLQVNSVWNQPDALFEWTAHDEAIKSIRVVASDSAAHHINGQIVTLSEKGDAKLWSSTGYLIGAIGKGYWKKKQLLEAEMLGIKAKANKLITEQV